MIDDTYIICYITLISESHLKLLYILTSLNDLVYCR